MIVRILGEGQFDLTDADFEALNVLDAAVESAVKESDVDAFGPALEALLESVRSHGSRHDVDTLDTSDLILPPAGSSIDEVRDLLSGDGLIPG
ncbi:MAG: hypothetical protein ACI379_09805 [Nocardioides sp.]|uniref:PspA-associated protein PspAA n=1 Tax=Nocardioides sp. TaxID=35761 RepID=UPI003EFE2E98